MVPSYDRSQLAELEELCLTGQALSFLEPQLEVPLPYWKPLASREKGPVPQDPYRSSAVMVGVMGLRRAKDATCFCSFVGSLGPWAQRTDRGLNLSGH